MKVWQESFQLVLPRDHLRSAGWHVSDIIRDLALHGGVLDPKWVKEIAIEEQNTNMMQLGLAFEDYLGNTQNTGIAFHPGEVWVDLWDVCEICGGSKDEHTFIEDDGHVFNRVRVFMSPDGISIVDADDYGDVIRYAVHFLHEFKFTKKSCRGFAQALRVGEKKLLMWLWQIMAYCYALKTLAAKLHVMFVNGNYTRDMNSEEGLPTYQIFRLEFSQEELEENWNMLTEHARSMIKNGKYRVTA